MKKTLDEKLANLYTDPCGRDFVLCDAKDPELALGLAAPGPDFDRPDRPHAFRSVQQLRDNIREVTQQGLVDIMLMSASTSERLTIEERIFDDSTVTPAARANDTTDLWCGMSGNYSSQPALPFSTTTIDHLQCGRYPGKVSERQRGVDLVLFSMTFNNCLENDRSQLEAYRTFRLEAESKGLRYILEVFAPNAPADPIVDVPRFVNDCIVRSLAGVTLAARPLFLKIPYFGPAAMEAIVHYDTTLRVGILGGSSGTTRDAFQMLWDAKQHGARAAFYGRKINHSEDQLTFVRHLRAVADEQIDPEEAVRSYHDELKQADVKPFRSLDADQKLTPKAD